MSPEKSGRSIFFAVVALLAAFAAPALAREEERPRQLFVFAPDENDKQLIAQYQQLQAGADEMDSEDVDVIYVIGDHMVKLPPPDMKTVSGDELRKHYHVDATGFRVVLIGKDGWEKARWSEPTKPGTILNRAQDMPRPKSETEQK